MHVRSSVSWLWWLVVLQVAVPASYYLVRDDRDDERFAWRMFSSVRLTRCEVSVVEGRSGTEAVAVELARVVHAGWQRSLERGRLRVIEHLLATRCAASSQLAYSALERRCTAPSGEPLPSAHYRYDCRRGVLVEAP